MKSDVRIATPEDFEGVMELCRMLHVENGQYSWDEAKVSQAMQRGVHADGGYLGVIGERGQPLKGIICLVLDRAWYTSDMYLLELFNFVHPDHRKSDYAKQMIAHAKYYAKELDLPLTVGVISNKRMEAKCRLYSRMIPKTGEFFTFRPGH